MIIIYIAAQELVVAYFKAISCKEFTSDSYDTLSNNRMIIIYKAAQELVVAYFKAISCKEFTGDSYDTLSNNRMIIIYKAAQELVVVYFKAIFLHFPEETKENHQSGCTVRYY
jgi:hypothetical protein